MNTRRADWGIATALMALCCFLATSCAGCNQQKPSEATEDVGSVTPPSATRERAGRLLERRVPAAERDDDNTLEHFFSALERTDVGANTSEGSKRATVRILQIGDSHTASDTTTGRLRELLQDRFGDGGRGLAHAGVPWRNFRQEQMGYGMTGAWDVYRVLYERSPGPWSVGGVRLTSSEAGATIVRRTCDVCPAGRRFDRYQIHYLKQAGGGSFDVELDGHTVASVETRAQHDSFGLFTGEAADAAHELKIHVNGDGSVALFAISTARSAGGIVYDALGINGAQAQHYLRADPDFTRLAVQSIAPDLIVVALGPNEAFDSAYRVEDPRADVISLLEKLEIYRDQYRRLLQRLRAGAPDASCLVLLPPDLKDRRADLDCSEWRFGVGPIDTPLCIAPPPQNYGGIINAQRHAAALEGCAVYEQQRSMGGEGSFSVWQQLGLAQRDGIHFTAAGYDLLGDNLFSDLMDAYERWLSGDSAALRTSIIFPHLATTARERRDHSTAITSE